MKAWALGFGLMGAAYAAVTGDCRSYDPICAFAVPLHLLPPTITNLLAVVLGSLAIRHGRKGRTRARAVSLWA